MSGKNTQRIRTEKILQDLTAAAFRNYAARHFTSLERNIAQIKDCDADYPHLHTLEGMLHLARGQNYKALSSFREALKHNQNDPKAHYNLALALERCNRFGTAGAHYLKAIKLKNDYVAPLNNLALLISRDDMKKALYFIRKALKIDPDCIEAWGTAGNIMLECGQVGKALEYYRTALRKAPDNLEIRSNYLLTLNYLADVSDEEFYKEHRLWGSIAWDKSRLNYIDFEVKEVSRGRLKVAYLSGDFRRHPAAFFLPAVIRGHNRRKFEVFCYSDNVVDDDCTALFKKGCDHWRKIHHLDNSELRQRIIEDGIDILVDLSGHTSTRLEIFASRSAPVQIAYFGYPSTSGIRNMDYRIGDDLTDLPEQQRFYSEKIMYMKHGMWLYQPPGRVLGKSKTLPCMKKGIFTFGSFNNVAKISDANITAWSRILNKLRSSRLILKSKAACCNNDVREHITRAFVASGVDENRIVFVPFHENQNEHLDYYNKVDLALDSFPYNGATTTFEALWMGVGVLTLAGSRHAQRYGVSIMSRLGLEKFVARSEDEYVNKAVELSKQINELQKLRVNLRNMLINSNMCREDVQIAEFERIYTECYNNLFKKPGDDS